VLGPIRPSWCWWTSAPRSPGPGRASSNRHAAWWPRSLAPAAPDSDLRPLSARLAADRRFRDARTACQHRLAQPRRRPCAVFLRHARRAVAMRGASLQSWDSRTRNAPTFPPWSRSARSRAGLLCRVGPGRCHLAGQIDVHGVGHQMVWTGALPAIDPELCAARLGRCARAADASVGGHHQAGPSRRKPSSLASTTAFSRVNDWSRWQGNGFRRDPEGDQRRLHAPGLPRSRAWRAGLSKC